MRIIRLGNPWALSFMIFPLIVVFLLVASKIFYKKGVRLTAVSSFNLKFSFLSICHYINLILIIMGFILITFSLTKPQSGIKKEKIFSKGVDIMIALDTSASMLMNDMDNRKRIDVAKEILLDFIKKRKGDRIGIITFGENSFVRCPATLDYEILQAIIKVINIDPNSKNAQRTAIGIGLASSINRLLKLKQSEEALSKIVILVTDGKNNSGEISPETALEIAIQNKIKIYTIGIGDRQEIDFDLLQIIAEKTEGKFFNSKNSHELKEIFDLIDRLEKHKIESVEFSRLKNIGYNYALIGILILLISILLNETIFRKIG